MRWLITGGCGFIGLNLIDDLLMTTKDEIVVLDDLSEGSIEMLEAVCEHDDTNSRVTFHEGSIIDAQTLRRSLDGVDAVVHLAAHAGVPASFKDPMHDCMNNVVGTLNCLESCKEMGVKRIIIASTNAVVGGSGGLVHEEMILHPISPYGASKMACEGYASAYSRTMGMGVVTLRFGNVYGPYSSNKSSVIAKFIKRAFRGEVLEVYGDGAQTRDFVYVCDLVRAIKLATENSQACGETFQIASGSETTILHMLDLLKCALNDAKLSDVVSSRKGERSGDIKNSCSNTSKALRILGWKSEVGMDEGLKRTVQWYLAKSKL